MYYVAPVVVGFWSLEANKSSYVRVVSIAGGPATGRQEILESACPQYK